MSAHNIRAELVQGSGAHDIRVRLVQGFDVEDIKQNFAYNYEDLYGSDENMGCSDEHSDRDNDNDYDDDEYYGMHGD